MKGMYTLKSSTTKVALQHMSKKTLYQLIRKLGRSFSNRLDTPEHNIASIMRYYAVGAFNHVAIIENAVKSRFNESQILKFSDMKPIKEIVNPHPNVFTKSGYYFVWKYKKTWELYSNEGNSMNIITIGRSTNIERKLIQRFPDYYSENFKLEHQVTIQ